MRAGILVLGILLLLLGLVFIASIIGAAFGAVLFLIGLVLIVIGAVTNEPHQAVVVYQPPPAAFQSPGYYPMAPAPPTPVMVNVQPAAPPPPQILRRCSYCGTVFPESQSKCPSCGAAF
jgi:hypothetical protein